MSVVVVTSHRVEMLVDHSERRFFGATLADLREFLVIANGIDLPEDTALFYDQEHLTLTLFKRKERTRKTKTSLQDAR